MKRIVEKVEAVVVVDQKTKEILQRVKSLIPPPPQLREAEQILER